MMAWTWRGSWQGLPWVPEPTLPPLQHLLEDFLTLTHSLIHSFLKYLLCKALREDLGLHYGAQTPATSASLWVSAALSAPLKLHPECILLLHPPPHCHQHQSILSCINSTGPPQAVVPLSLLVQMNWPFLSFFLFSLPPSLFSLLHEI